MCIEGAEGLEVIFDRRCALPPDHSLVFIGMDPRTPAPSATSEEPDAGRVTVRLPHATSSWDSKYVTHKLFVCLKIVLDEGRLSPASQSLLFFAGPSSVARACAGASSASCPSRPRGWKRTRRARPTARRPKRSGTQRGPRPPLNSPLSPHLLPSPPCSSQTCPPPPPSPPRRPRPPCPRPSGHRRSPKCPASSATASRWWGARSPPACGCARSCSTCRRPTWSPSSRDGAPSMTWQSVRLPSPHPSSPF